MPSRRTVALAWHQRTSALETRERLLAVLARGTDRVVLATCHRVELYVAIPFELDAGECAQALHLGPDERASLSVLDGRDALAHLFAVAAGLDSAIVGESQILAQVRRACAATTEPALVAALVRALHVGRA